MTPLRPDPSSAPVARTLYDIAQGLDSPLDAELRLRRALRLLRRIVPYDRCALLEAPAAGPARLVIEPDAPEERAALSRMLTRFSTVITGEAKQGVGWRPPDVAHLALWASPSHLAVPLVGLDQVLGVLFVRQGWADAYTDDHLRLLSVVASQLAAYLTACRLRAQEAQIVSEHEAARAAAEADSRAKDEFLAMLVRELRHPLVSIRFALLTIRDQAERDPVVQRARDVVERQVKHLARMLDDLLEAFRVVRDKVDLRKESVTLQTIVTAALETVRGTVDARRHGLSVSMPEEPLWLEADSTRLTRAVANVMDNAVKYTPPGGEISVAAYREDDEVVLRVRDTGIGISPEMLPRIFDLFAQGDPSLARARGNLGVGLTLARALVEFHGGKITAESEGPGRGSEFVVRLPAGAAGGSGGRGQPDSPSRR
jgi:signal transduction histidine kinase